jgi:hypothetical protein
MPLALVCEDVKADRPLEISIGAMDCDGSTVLPVVEFDPGGLPPGGVSLDCSFEEDFPEMSGHNDYAGSIRYSVPVSAWTAPGGVEVDRTATNPKDCGNGAYTAHIKVQATPSK